MSAYVDQFVAAFHSSRRAEGTLIVRFAEVLSKAVVELSVGTVVCVEKSISVKLVQLENAEFPILVTLLGMMMLVKPVQL